MTISNEQRIAQSLIGTMRGRGHLENHGSELRTNGGFCVVRDEVSYPELVDVAKWLTVELMGRDTLTTSTAYWLIPDIVDWLDIFEREYTSASALSEYNLSTPSNADMIKEDRGIARVDGLRPLAIIPMVSELAKLFPIGTAAVLNLNFYLDTRDSMSALFVMDSGTYEIASSATNEKSGQPIWRNHDYAIYV